MCADIAFKRHGYQGMQTLFKRLQIWQELSADPLSALKDETFHMAGWTDRRIGQPMDGLTIFQQTLLMTTKPPLTL